MRRIFPETRFHLGDFLRLLAVNVAHDLREAARGSGLLRGNLSDILGFRLMQFWGTYRGFGTRADLSSVLKRRFDYPTEPAREPPTRDRTAARRIDYSARDGRSHTRS